MHIADLLTAGFRRSTESNATKSKHVVALYQKRVYNASGRTLYFIEVWEWEPCRDTPVSVQDRARFSIDATLYRDGLTMDLNLYYEPTMTPQDIFDFYARAHAALDCTEDPHNN